MSKQPSIFIRFGLIYVDFETKERILKDSSKWFQQLIK